MKPMEWGRSSRRMLAYPSGRGLITSRPSVSADHADYRRSFGCGTRIILSPCYLVSGQDGSGALPAGSAWDRLYSRPTSSVRTMALASQELDGFARCNLADLLRNLDLCPAGQVILEISGAIIIHGSRELVTIFRGIREVKLGGN